MRVISENQPSPHMFDCWLALCVSSFSDGHTIQGILWLHSGALVSFIWFLVFTIFVTLQKPLYDHRSVTFNFLRLKQTRFVMKRCNFRFSQRKSQRFLRRKGNRMPRMWRHFDAMLLSHQTRWLCRCTKPEGKCLRSFEEVQELFSA